MADKSKIEWTDATWNPITGCSVVSPGCTNCYAMRLAGTRLRDHPSRHGLTNPSKAGPVWNGQVRFNEQWLDQPLKWRKPRRIFVCAHGDLFHENVPDSWIDRVFAVMALAERHTFQVLTKRSARMRAYVNTLGRQSHEGRSVLLQRRRGWVVRERHPVDAVVYLPNVWLGVSAEDQTRADARIPDLLGTPAAKRFVSAEPLLGEVDVGPWLAEEAGAAYKFLSRWYGPDGFDPDGSQTEAKYQLVKPCPLDWVIAGGESGPGARPMHPDWIRSLRDQCAAAGVPFFFKQWGAWAPAPEDMNFTQAEEFAEGRLFEHQSSGHTLVRVGKKAAGATFDGQTHEEFPA